MCNSGAQSKLAKTQGKDDTKVELITLPSLLLLFLLLLPPPAPPAASPTLLLQPLYNLIDFFLAFSPRSAFEPTLLARFMHFVATLMTLLSSLFTPCRLFQAHRFPHPLVALHNGITLQVRLARWPRWGTTPSISAAFYNKLNQSIKPPR